MTREEKKAEIKKILQCAKKLDHKINDLINLPKPLTKNECNIRFMYSCKLVIDASILKTQLSVIQSQITEKSDAKTL